MPKWKISVIFIRVLKEYAKGLQNKKPKWQAKSKTSESKPIELELQPTK